MNHSDALSSVSGQLFTMHAGNDGSKAGGLWGLQQQNVATCYTVPNLPTLLHDACPASCVSLLMHYFAWQMQAMLRQGLRGCLPVSLRTTCSIVQYNATTTRVVYAGNGGGGG